MPCSPLSGKARGVNSGVSFVLAGRVINCKFFATSLSESTLRKGDCRKETLSPVFSVSSKTGSCVVLVKSERAMVSLSVSFDVR